VGDSGVVGGKGVQGQEAESRVEGEKPCGKHKCRKEEEKGVMCTQGDMIRSHPAHWKNLKINVRIKRKTELGLTWQLMSIPKLMG
jgi:hypothetical protein